MADPYLLCDENSLRNVAANATGNYWLVTANITLTSDWTPIPTFAGVFDGGTHTIQGLTVNAAGGAGLFGEMLSSQVRSLNLKGVTVTGGQVGAVTGSMVGGSIEDVAVDGTVVGTGPANEAGGLVGYMENGAIRRVRSAANVSGATAGGVVGHLNPVFAPAAFEELLATGTIQGTTAAGGILGEVTLSAVNPPTLTHVRGLANVMGAGTNSGGLVGRCGSGTWASALVTGSVEAAGGAVAGQPQSCTWNNVFFDDDVILAGNVAIGVVGLTTAAAQSPGTYAPGPFPMAVWTVGANAYPALLNVPPPL